MNETRSTRYQRLRRRARAASLMSGLAVLGGVGLTPLAGTLAMAADTAVANLSPWLRTVASLTLFVTMILLLWELAAVPALLYFTQRVGRRYGTSDMAVGDVLGAQVQSTLIILPVVLAATGIVQASVWVGGTFWWLLAGGALAGGALLAMRDIPALLMRMSGTRSGVPAALAAQVQALAARAGVHVADVIQVDESGVTALVGGIGRSRRIFLSSDVLRDWTDDEVAVVVAHELGHCAHQDAWRTAGLDACLLALSLGVADVAMRSAGPTFDLAGPGSLAWLPGLGLAASLAWLAVTPLRHAQSRRQERQADAFALALTGGVDAFDTAIRRLGERHLAEERPTALTRWLFHRHPSVGERLEYARAYRDLVS